MNKFWKVGATVALIVGIVFGGAALSASAHNKSASITCTDYSVSLTNYDQTATAKIVLDGVTLQDGTFEGNYSQSGVLTSDATHTTHELAVTVRSNDGVQYNLDFDEVTPVCYTAPPVHNPVITYDYATEPICDPGDGNLAYTRDIIYTYESDWDDSTQAYGEPFLINTDTTIRDATPEECPPVVTPVPTPTPTPTPSVTTPVAPQELAETGSTPLGGFFFAVGMILSATGGVLARRWWDKRGPGGTAVVTA